MLQTANAKKKEVLDNADRYALECVAKSHQAINNQGSSAFSQSAFAAAFNSNTPSAFAQQSSAFSVATGSHSSFGNTQQQQQPSNVFSTQPTSVFGGSSFTQQPSFTQPPPQQTAPQQSAFTQQTPSFGQQSSAFGQPSPFGQGSFQVQQPATSSDPVWGQSTFEFGRIPTTEPPMAER